MDSMRGTTTGQGPLDVAGYLTPVADEIDARDLPVTGVLPAELTGRYLRNGPNPRPGQDAGHLFAGHGMIHGVRLHGGRAQWYRNRWVRTRLFGGESAIGGHELAMNSANTHVIEHGGRVLALCEGGLPYELTGELATVGPCDFGGRLTTAMTAHPKQDPDSGELLFFGYGVRPPYLTYHRLSASGELVYSAPIDVPGPTLMHDFAITEHHVVWLDLPVTFDFALLGRGMPFQWNDAYGARIGVMARDGGPVRWFDVEPCYVFHVGNAREDATGRVVLDAVRYDRASWACFWSLLDGQLAGAPPGSPEDASVASAAPTCVSTLHRWTLDPGTGVAAEERIDDRGVEFPTVSDALVGRDNRYLYTVATNAGGPHATAILKHDLATGGTDAHHLGAGCQAGEAVFVAARDARYEDDGWLLSIITSCADDASSLFVLDATDVAGPPAASVRLPRRVPAGFHGSWIPDVPTADE